MSYTVWYRGRLLGRTDLAMPIPGANFRAGQLEPTPELGRAWPELGPAVEEYVAAGAAVGSAVAALPAAGPDADPAGRGRQVYERLAAHPGAARLRAASEALARLGLELRDGAGRAVAAQTVLVQEVRPPAWVPAEAVAREVEEARREGVEIPVRSYVVVIQQVTGAPDTRSTPRTPA